MLGCIMFGTCGTLCRKAQDLRVVNESGELFKHPYWQSFMMSLGQFTSLFIYFSRKAKCGPLAKSPERRRE